jgi:hypothetical protein
MAQPKTGNSHLRGSQFIGSGLYVTGVLRVGGQVNFAGALNVTGTLSIGNAISIATESAFVKDAHLATGSLGVLHEQNLTYVTTGPSSKIHAITGQIARGMKFMAPGVGITIRGLAFSLQTGTSHASGLRFSLAVKAGLSGTQAHKGYVTVGQNVVNIYKSGLSATVPAGAAVGLVVNLAGKTGASGHNLNVTAYYTRNANP